MHAVVWIPLWPIEALRAYGLVKARDGVAVYDQDGVISFDSKAAQQGIYYGMKKRYAKALAPEIELVRRRFDLEALNFEKVIRACEKCVSTLTVLRPGMLIFHARGPIRMFGSQETLAENVIEKIVEDTGYEAHVGLGEGTLCAILAAYNDQFIENARAYLDPLPIDKLEYACFSTERRAQMKSFIADLHLLGINTVLELRNLDRALLYSRFGMVARLAVSLLELDFLFPELSENSCTGIVVERHLDPPVTNSESFAFLVRELGTELVRLLEYEGYFAKELSLFIRTSAAAEMERTWHLDAVDVPVIVDRCRWQLKVWLSELVDNDSYGENQNITYLELRAQNLFPAGFTQGVLWGREEKHSQLAHKAINRLQALVGLEKVVTPILKSQLDPSSAYELEPWEYKNSADRKSEIGEWPGAIPRPWPGRILQTYETITIVDPRGHICAVNSLGRFYCIQGCGFIEPSSFISKRYAGKITSYSSPWLHRAQWWTLKKEKEIDRVWCEIVVDYLHAFLCRWESSAWHLVGEYV
ncbi:protein ImuB [Arcanobacterium pluranimalium]|uniref:Y-family DNA polymerase n=1 Tax=Arcanobacterium pluranimalium TaxID=108028 RepID=UPI00195661F9|nr:hypothetical protein [Arcanobacterium pluranimalium]MBM7825353.1 protein ImuB [Arcanobacterium pluranimalium]